MTQTRGLAAITGASSGIGEAFAEELARRGHDLIIVARDTARLEGLAARLRERRGVAVEVRTADLTDPAALHALEARIAGEPRLALLVNNAGFGTSGAFETLDRDTEEAEVRLNVLAVTRLCHAALPGMVERGHGGIINVASIAAFVPGPYAATYHATKAYVMAFSEALHEEAHAAGVTVQALCPGFVRTGFQMRAGVNGAAIPGPAFMTPRAVVRGSLRALDRRHAVYVPGMHYRFLMAVSRVVPRTLVRKLLTRVGRAAYLD
ncbi:MAG: SDR family oxidoreductase [Dehalococcoidia bacterium]